MTQRSSKSKLLDDHWNWELREVADILGKGRLNGKVEVDRHWMSNSMAIKRTREGSELTERGAWG